VPFNQPLKNENLGNASKTLFARALCCLTALYATLATIGTAFATLLADETTAERGQTTLKTATAAALTRWRLLLILHWSLWRIVALLLGRRATVRRLRVLRLRGVALRRALVVVLRGRHGYVGSEDVPKVGNKCVLQSAVRDFVKARMSNAMSSQVGDDERLGCQELWMKVKVVEGPRGRRMARSGVRRLGRRINR
jgi:hypothetical protein